MKSTSQLNIEALDYRFFPSTSLKVYLKACVGILDEAQLAFQGGDLERAYVFYVRYVDLCTNKLSRHPEYLGKVRGQAPETALHRQEYLQLIRLEVPAVLKITEDLRKQLDLEYGKHKLSLAKNIAKPKQQHHAGADNEIEMPSVAKLPSTFDDGVFNRSIRSFQESSTFASYSSVSKGPETKVQQASDANKSEEKTETFYFYPELPQLSFPTF